MTVGVVTDSACSLPAGKAEEEGVTVVPMWLTIGGQQYPDGDVSLEDLVTRLGEGVTTSAPSPGELAQAAEAAEDGDGVVVLTVSQRMSAVYQAAQLAAGLVAAKVEVLDTGTAAGAQGLVVLAAARAAASGAELADVVAVARQAAGRARLVATLPSLEHLARSGRVPGAAAWGARWLGLHPVFEFTDGKAKPMRPARGRQQAYQRLLGLLDEEVALPANIGRRLHVAALHALEPEMAARALYELGHRTELGSALVAAFSPVMVAHTGPGLFGLAWWWEEVPGAGPRVP